MADAALAGLQDLARNALVIAGTIFAAYVGIVALKHCLKAITMPRGGDIGGGDGHF